MKILKVSKDFGLTPDVAIKAIEIAINNTIDGRGLCYMLNKALYCTDFVIEDDEEYPGYCIIRSLNLVIEKICVINQFVLPNIRESYYWSNYNTEVRRKVLIELLAIFQLIKKHGYKQPAGKYKNLIQEMMYENTNRVCIQPVSGETA